MKAYIVEREALVQNIQALVGFAKGVPVWGVLKGNGYGLGVLPMAQLLWENGVQRFAVTEMREAALLREAYPEAPILMLRATGDAKEIGTLLEQRVILTVSGPEMAETIDRLAAERGAPAEVHLCIDTGMGRYGFLPADFDNIVAVFKALPHLSVTGMYTHFHSAFCSEKATRAQFAAFTALAERLQAAGCETGMLHCCNSSAFLRWPEMHLGGVRLGSAFLGRLAIQSPVPLRRIGYVEATVEDLRTLPKGHSVGYGAGYICKRPTRIAVVGVGWYHGFGAERENDLFRVRDRIRAIVKHLLGLCSRKRITVSVNGQSCPVLGHIGMVHSVVDVTAIDCALGERVVLQVNPLNVKGLEVEFRRSEVIRD